MADLLFRFEEEKLPPAVVISTLVLAAVFIVGLLYRVASVALF